MAQQNVTFEKEIETYYDENKISEQMLNVKLEFKEILNGILHDYFGQHVELVVTGSTSTKLGTKDSDLDLCLLVPPIETNSSYSSISLILTKMLVILEEKFSNICTKIRYIDAKDVPVIHMKDVKFNNMEFGIDISNNNINGIRAAHLLSHYAQDERFRKLLLIVRKWAKANGIDVPREGTFSGFGLTLLVLFFLQNGTHPPTLPNLQIEMPTVFNDKVPLEEILDHNVYSDVRELIKNKISNNKTVGQLLIEFFDYYTNCINFEHDMLSVSSGTVKPKPDNEVAFIFVEEPYDGLTNVVPRTVIDFGFLKIQRAFNETYAKLRNSPQLCCLNVC